MLVDAREGDGVRHLELAGLAVAIEYVDTEGCVTKRRITLRRISIWDDGGIVWSDYCHERRAARTFRCERIQFVVDMDGVIHEDAKSFLTDEIGLDLTPPTPTHGETAVDLLPPLVPAGSPPTILQVYPEWIDDLGGPCARWWGDG